MLCDFTYLPQNILIACRSNDKKLLNFKAPVHISADFSWIILAEKLGRHAMRTRKGNENLI